MPGRPARKRLHYLRAVYQDGTKPQETLQELLRTALHHKRMSATEITFPQIGTMAVRSRTSTRAGNFVMAIGAGVPGEAMSTMGISVIAMVDAEASAPPPQARAFKLADAFCLIRDDDLIVCLDGVRVPTVGAYLSRLVSGILNRPDAGAFELMPVSDLEQEDVLDREGVKEITLAGTMYAATGDLNDPGATGAWRRFVESLRALLERDAGSDAERDAMVAHFAELNVSTVISVKGGSRAEPLLLNAMDSAGRELLSDDDDGFDISLRTLSNSVITPTQLVLGHYVNLTRQEGRNDLRYQDVWLELQEYTDILRQRGQWQN